MQALLWTSYVVFSAYTLYCLWRENIFRAFGSLLKTTWGRQVTADLFVGLFLFAGFVLKMEGLTLTSGLWIAGFLTLGNPATLLYAAIHYDTIAAKLMH